MAELMSRPECSPSLEKAWITLKTFRCYIRDVIDGRQFFAFIFSGTLAYQRFGFRSIIGMASNDSPTNGTLVLFSACGGMYHLLCPSSELFPGTSADRVSIMGPQLYGQHWEIWSSPILRNVKNLMEQRQWGSFYGSNGRFPPVSAILMSSVEHTYICDDVNGLKNSKRTRMNSLESIF